GAGKNQMNNTKFLTLAKMDTVVVKIYIDELDILSVSEGQKATVKLDAIEGKEFEGTIKSIGKTASSNAGTAKFIAEIEIPMDPQMRMGMTASVSIVILTAENILTLPINAMQQTGDQMFVYRGYDEETMALKDEQVVTTGIANKDLVEIKEGLNEGDEVYYIDASNNPLAQYMMQAQEG
ncbi:MAG: HlyD family efflux transporter periplasmic adaptor subunit, partial [Clostridiales bacterium]|nr:HlyD family efflux transporter periplasmic adaptor subunit [Clostridiales bacterium]